MIINEQLRFIFLHTPKCGGTYLSQNVFLNLPGSRFLKPPHSPRAGVDVIWENYKTFSTLRNPLEWYLSIYEYHKKTGEWIVHFFDKDNSFASWLPRFISFDIDEKELDFEHGGMSDLPFYKELLRHKITTHGWLTYLLLFVASEKSRDIFINHDKVSNNFPDYFQTVRIFDLYEVDKIPKYLGLPVQIDAKTRTATKGSNYNQYYTEDLKRLVFEKDRLLFETFGYRI